MVPLSVAPKRGKAIWWADTMEAQPFVSDPRTHHAAEAVVGAAGSSEKFAANFWLHQYDYEQAHLKGCTDHTMWK